MKRLILLSLVLTLCATSLAFGNDDEDLGGFDDIYQMHKAEAKKKRSNEAKSYARKFGPRRPAADQTPPQVIVEELDEFGTLDVARPTETPLALDNYRYQAVRHHVRNTHRRRHRTRLAQNHQRHDPQPLFVLPSTVVLVTLFVVIGIHGPRFGSN